MPNAPIGSNRPRINPTPNDRLTPENQPVSGANTTTGSARVTDALETFRRADAASLLGNGGRAQAKVISLKNAPGLLNGSVVLPRSGSDHAAVGQLQGALQTLARRDGASELNVPRTGTWDQATADAVKAFQTQQGLSADGVVGPRTAAALEKSLKQGQPSSILVGRMNDIPIKAPALDPASVGKAAEMLVDKHGDNYGVQDAWYNIDPNHALPANVSLGGLKGRWKCNLFGGNAMTAAGFEPPYYGNRGKGEYPNANQFFKWSDKYAEKYGNKSHFKMVSELAVEGMEPEVARAKILEFMKTIEPGDLVMTDHRGGDVSDGGHTRVATTAFDPETMTFEAAQASSDAGRIKTTGVGAFAGEEHIWVLRPNRPADD